MGTIAQVGIRVGTSAGLGKLDVQDGAGAMQTPDRVLRTAGWAPSETGSAQPS